MTRRAEVRRGGLLLCLAAFAALALAACGGGSGDEKAITETIETVATTSRPSNCTKLETQRFNEQNDEQQGKAATKACEMEAEGDAEKAEAAEVSNVSVNGSKATAEVKFEGGGLGAQTIEVALVEEGGAWKLDQVERFVHYDGAVIAKAFKEQFEANPEGIDPKQAECITEGFARASAAEAGKLLLSGSRGPIEELAKSCA